MKSIERLRMELRMRRHVEELRSAAYHVVGRAVPTAQQRGREVIAELADEIARREAAS